MTAERINMSFLPSHSEHLTDFVVRTTPFARHQLLLRCIEQYPVDIRGSNEVVDVVRKVREGHHFSRDEVELIDRVAEDLANRSIGADEAGDEKEALRLHGMFSILSAVTASAQGGEMSPEALDKSLYYMFEVLTDSFIDSVIHRLDEEDVR